MLARPPTGKKQPVSARRRSGTAPNPQNNLRRATTDELTGARTRTFGLEEIARELERAHRTGGTLVLAFVDVDGLKAGQRHEGHLAGDALLRLVGETIRANVRPYDLIVRYGGDELRLRDAESQCARSQSALPEDRRRAGGGQTRTTRSRSALPRLSLPKVCKSCSRALTRTCSKHGARRRAATESDRLSRCAPSGLSSQRGPAAGRRFSSHSSGLRSGRASPCTRPTARARTSSSVRSTSGMRTGFSGSRSTGTTRSRARASFRSTRC